MRTAAGERARPGTAVRGARRRLLGLEAGRAAVAGSPGPCGLLLTRARPSEGCAGSGRRERRGERGFCVVLGRLRALLPSEAAEQPRRAAAPASQWASAGEKPHTGTRESRRRFRGSLWERGEDQIAKFRSARDPWSPLTARLQASHVR